MTTKQATEGRARAQVVNMGDAIKIIMKCKAEWAEKRNSAYEAVKQDKANYLRDFIERMDTQVDTCDILIKAIRDEQRD